MREALRRTAVIAATEVRRTSLQMDRRTLFVLVAITLTTGLLAPALLEKGFDFDHGFYQVAVDPGHPLHAALAADPKFVVVSPGSEGADAALIGTAIQHDPADAKSAAAATAIQAAAEAYGVALMLQERDQGAAFPVRVEVAYEKVDPAMLALPRDSGSTEPPADDPEPSPGRDPAPGAGGDENSGNGTGSDAPPVDTGDTSGFTFLPGKNEVSTPSTMTPPFPFRSLILAYLFLIPMNFVVQGYASSIIGERLQRKGEILLQSPASALEIVAGKTLPHALTLVVIVSAIAYFIGAGPLAVVAMLPVVLAFLALEFCAALFARSFRELTFLTVFVSVGLTIFCFLPAVFTDIHPVALISPITLVVMSLRGEAIGVVDVLFSTLPLTLVSLVCFYLGLRLYTEEDLFHQKPVKQKIVDALAIPMRRPLSAMKMSILLIPFVFVAQLILVTGAVAWGMTGSIFLVLVLAASVEEVGKSAAVAAGYARDRIPRTLGIAALTGVFAGLGFFIAEKLFLLASLVGLYHLDAGAAVFSAGSLPLPWPVLLLLPAGLHVVTATLTSIAAAQGRRVYLAGLAAATLLHALYNHAVVSFS